MVEKGRKDDEIKRWLWIVPKDDFSLIFKDDMVSQLMYVCIIMLKDDTASTLKTIAWSYLKMSIYPILGRLIKDIKNDHIIIRFESSLKTTDIVTKDDKKFVSEDDFGSTYKPIWNRLLSWLP